MNKNEYSLGNAFLKRHADKDLFDLKEYLGIHLTSFPILIMSNHVEFRPLIDLLC